MYDSGGTRWTILYYYWFFFPTIRSSRNDLHYRKKKSFPLSNTQNIDSNDKLPEEKFLYIEALLIWSENLIYCCISCTTIRLNQLESLSKYWGNFTGHNQLITVIFFYVVCKFVVNSVTSLGRKHVVFRKWKFSNCQIDFNYIIQLIYVHTNFVFY